MRGVEDLSGSQRCLGQGPEFFSGPAGGEHLSVVGQIGPQMIRRLQGKPQAHALGGGEFSRGAFHHALRDEGAGLFLRPAENRGGERGQGLGEGVVDGFASAPGRGSCDEN